MTTPDNILEVTGRLAFIQKLDLPRKMLSNIDPAWVDQVPRRVSGAAKDRISITPFKPAPKPMGLSAIKSEIGQRWPMTGLLDVLKEAALDTGFLDPFETSASRVVLSKAVLDQRLLLCFYGLGTNAVLSGSPVPPPMPAMRSFCMCTGVSSMRVLCGTYAPASPMPRLQSATQRSGEMPEQPAHRIPRSSGPETATDD